MLSSNSLMADHGDSGMAARAAEARRQAEAAERKYIETLLEQNNDLIAQDNIRLSEIDQLTDKLNQLLYVAQVQNKTIDQLKLENRNLLNMLDFEYITPDSSLKVERIPDVNVTTQVLSESYFTDLIPEHTDHEEDGYPGKESNRSLRADHGDSGMAAKAAEATRQREIAERKYIGKLAEQNNDLIAKDNLRRNEIDLLTSKVSQLIDFTQDQNKKIEQLKLENQNHLNMLGVEHDNKSLIVEKIPEVTCVGHPVSHPNDRIPERHTNETGYYGKESSGKGDGGEFGIAHINVIKDRVNNPPVSIKTNAGAALSATDQLINELNEQESKADTTQSNLSAFQTAILAALGMGLLPEEIVVGASAIMTALLIGPVTEGMTVELLANASFMQAASRAGAVLGAGKYLNIFGVFTSARLEAKTFVQHPCKGMSAPEVVQKTIGLGVETLRDKLLLWSGLGEDYGVTISQEFSIKNGYTTLEMTPGGKWLHEMGLFENDSPFTKQEAYDIWEAVSLEAMKKASGQVQAVVGIVSVKSIYVKELAELVKNPNVIGDVIEFEVKPRVIFKNGR